MTKETWLNRILENSLLYGDKIALIVKDEKISYRDLIEVSYGVSLKLKQCFKKKDYLIIKSTTTISFYIMYLASNMANLIFVPVDESSPDLIIKEKIKRLNPKLVFDFSFNPDGIKTLKSKQFIEGINSKYKSIKDKKRVAILLETSGTTSIKKEVEIYSSEFNQAFEIGKILNYSEETILYLFAPPSHYAFYIMSTAALIYAGTVVFSPSLVDVKFFKDAIDLGVNSIHMTPTTMDFYLTRGKDFLEEINKNMKTISFAGEKLSINKEKEIKTVFKNTDLFILYGSTETGAISYYNFQKDEVIDSCVGYTFNNVNVKIANDLIKVKSPYMMKKYLYDNKKIKSFTLDDLGYFVDERLYLKGRKSDIINIGGLKVNPLEVEEKAKNYEGVIDSVCVLSNNNILSLFYESEHTIDNNSLRDFLFSSLETYKVPRYYSRVDKINKNISGKKDRSFYRTSL